MPLRDRIIMVKRTRPIQVRLPNGRTCISRYKRSRSVAIPPNIELSRPYKQRPTLKNKRHRRPTAQQQGQGLSSILKFATTTTTTKKKKVKNPPLQKLGRAAQNELPNFYSKGKTKLRTKN